MKVKFVWVTHQEIKGSKSANKTAKMEVKQERIDSEVSK